jgi:hypothetical protein
MSSTPQRRSKLLSLASRAMPSNSRYSERLSSAPNSPSIPTDITLRPPSPAGSTSGDALAPPSMPFANRAEGNGLSSRRSSVSSKGTLEAGSIRGGRPNSLSVNYVPAKFTKLHAPGDWAHRRAKIGGGRDAFAKDAQRMGKMGTVDDDEGVVFQLGKGGLKKKKPKLRWNRFKWILFGANGVVSCPHRCPHCYPQSSPSCRFAVRCAHARLAHLLWPGHPRLGHSRLAQRVLPIRRHQSGQPHRAHP